ncbi:MAG: DUF4845 domain-containing protein [Gallionellaceae bacterium]
MRAMANKQRGVSFSGFIWVAFLGILVLIAAMKIIPPYMENAEIKELFITIANDPEMKTASKRDIRMSFSRRSTIDNVTAIKSADIEISKADGKLSLSATYAVKRPLFGNASLLLEFSPSSANN